jgi:hypothetical protein
MKHWQNDFPVWFCNEEKDLVMPDSITQFKTGRGEFSDRLTTILEAIETPKVFYIQEDIWITKSIPGVVNYCNDLMDYEDLLRVEIGQNSGYYQTIHDPVTQLRYFNIHSDYLLNHQPAIWDREYYLSCMQPGETPWENELRGTERLRGGERLTHKLALFETHWFTHVCQKGKMKPEGIKMMQYED